MEVLKKTLKELIQSNAELKLQLVEQKERFLNYLAQQEVQFDQMMELLMGMKEESPQNTLSQAQPRWSEFRTSKKRKVDLCEDQKSSENCGESKVAVKER